MIKKWNPGVETLHCTYRTCCWSSPASGTTAKTWGGRGYQIKPPPIWHSSNWNGSKLLVAFWHFCARDADTVLRMFWSQVKQEGRVPMNKLLVEMLEANTQWSWQKAPKAPSFQWWSPGWPSPGWPSPGPSSSSPPWSPLAAPPSTNLAGF